MKLHNISLALLLGAGMFVSCEGKLDLTNPNQQTTKTFGNTVKELEETVIAAYNHTRMEGTYARVGYNIDVCRGDEVWNSSQVWYMPFDDLDDPFTDEISQWVWRDWYYTINVCNYILSKTADVTTESTTQWQRIKGQALFLRGLGYYNLAGYFQNPPLITDYGTYSTLDGLYGENSTYDDILDLVEKDFSEAMTLLPSRDEGGQWAAGRATCGAAAGYYARTLMVRHKYSEALTVLKDIINKKYGSYKLMADYGDNFQEGSAYENNDESLYEVQFLDYGSQGTDDEWTPVNTSAYATQGHAIESNYAPGKFGGWADLSVSPWLYNLYKEERTTSGSLDPRLYWTCGTYESAWGSYAYGNVAYGEKMTADKYIVTNNSNGGIPLAKNTNLRTGIYTTVVTGLKCGINLRLMRYSDVLLRAAECENEVNGPTQQAIDWINQVRTRVGLPNLSLSDFNTADKLFEQIANVERPKEFGCEFGRGFDLIRWGFFYSSDRLQQLKEHGTFKKFGVWSQQDVTDGKISEDYVNYGTEDPTKPVSYSMVGTDAAYKSSFDTYVAGHEFLPVYQGTLNANPNMKGNSANYNTDNSSYWKEKGWTVHPVVDLTK